MADFFLDNLLTSMSVAFNSSDADGSSVADLNLSDDKTLKWRGLHNNQHPRRKYPKKYDAMGKEEKSSQGREKTSSPQNDKEKVMSSGSVEDDPVADTGSNQEDDCPNKTLKKPQSGAAEIVTRRLRRSRVEENDVDKPSPLKRRGRSKKVSDAKEKPTLKNSKIAEEPTEKQIIENGQTRKLRRSERNTNVEIKVEIDDDGGAKTVDKDFPKKFDSEIVKNEDETPEKNTRRSIRLGNRVDNDDNSSLKEQDIGQFLLDVKVPIEDAKISEQSIANTIDIKVKQITNEKTPKKRGRRAKVASQEKSSSQEKSETKKSVRNTAKLNSNYGTPVETLSKDKSAAVDRIPLTSSQRPLRRIKPTAKILENDELRYEFETKNIARMTACTDVLDTEDVKLKKEIESKEVDITPPGQGVDMVKKKLFPKGTDNLNVDNIYPNLLNKICPDPAVFLSEIKAAKINLHRSPEDKKLNKKQQRKLLKQKEKHFEKLGLRRNTKSEFSDSIDSSDNEEFLPSKKIKVGKTNVTLRGSKLYKDAVVSFKGANSSAVLGSGTKPKDSIEHPINNNKVQSEEITHRSPEGLICLCQSSSKFYTHYTPETSFCCALDNIEEQKVGCCNQLGGELLNLLRPSPRVGYMILCADHKKRLRAHNCCAGCGVFCTQGNFMLCPKKHFFHGSCAQKLILNTPYDPTNETSYTSPILVLKCPHCGTDTPEKTSLVTMKCQSLPVFFPSQKGFIKHAKMSIRDGQIEKSEPKRKLLHYMDLEKLIPESVMNVVERQVSDQVSEFTSRDMFYSISNDDLERVAEILASGYDITTEMEQLLNGTCLHLAARVGTLQMTYLLLCRNSSDQFMNTLDKDLRTAVMCSIIGDKMNILKLLIQCGADLTTKGPDGMTCLHIAAKLGNLEAAKLVVDCYKSSASITHFEKFLNSPDAGGWTAMVWAAENGYTDVVSMLLNNGADPNLCDAENNTVLHWATLSNHVETILVLLRTNVDCNVQNINGDTPLHIACRQSSTRICLMLVVNGADLMVKNNAEQIPYDCIPNEESQCARAIGFNMQMRSFGPVGLRTKIICSDISNGREDHPIQVVKCDRSGHLDMDDVLLPDFKYITKSILLQNSIQIDYRVSQMRICSCNDGCNTNKCQCSTISVQNWYTQEGRLSNEFNYDDPALIFECNDVCGCNKIVCKNRVVQNGIKIPLQIYECQEKSKNWGVRTLISVPKGSFVAEYTGEILTDLEADRRTDDSYFFDLESSEHCIDANYYGNISRFFNHSCVPNIVPVRVFFEHQDFRFPRIAFFACQDISAGDELAFDYGDKFWAVKQKYFTCKCRSPACRYSTPILQAPDHMEI